MGFKKVLLSFLAGTSVALGSGLVYKKRKARLAEARRNIKLLEKVVSLALEKLSKISSGRVSVAEIYFFIWIMERVCTRQKTDFPSFNFKVKGGMLTSAKLTFILRRMIEQECLILEDSYLVPLAPLTDRAKDNGEDQKIPPGVSEIIEEIAAQWQMEFPEEPLVRFGQLFK